MILQRGVLSDLNSGKGSIRETSRTESTSTTTLPKPEISSNMSPEKMLPIFVHVTRYNKHQKTRLWKQPAASIRKQSREGRPSSRAVGKTTKAEGRMTVMETPEKRIGTRRLICRSIRMLGCFPRNLQGRSYGMSTLVNNLADTQRQKDNRKMAERDSYSWYLGCSGHRW